MKCSKCGHEFEGKFCPNCGEPVGGAPKSSNPSSAPESRAKVPPIIGKLYAFMPKIFSIIFAVFAVLMLVCFAGPVTKSELAEEFGGASDSVYSYVSGGEEESADSWEEEFALSADDDFDFGEEGGASMQGICAALVAFGALAVVVAAIGLAFALYVPLTAKKIKVGDRAFKLKSIFDIASVVLLFVIFVLGCILGANAGDEFGLSEPGAAPICIIFFSLLFGLLMGVSFFGRKLISLIWTNAPVEYEAARAAERASLVEPLEPLIVEKPQKPKKPYKYIVPDDVQNSVSDDEKRKIVRHIKAREAIAYVCMLPYTLVIGSIGAIIHYAGTKRADFWKVKNRDSIKASCAIGIIMAVLSIVAAASLSYYLLYGYGTNVIAQYIETKNDIKTLQNYSEIFDDYSDEELVNFCFEGDNLAKLHSALYVSEASGEAHYRDSMCIKYFMESQKYFMEGTGIQAFEQGYNKYCAPLMEFVQISIEHNLLFCFGHDIYHDYLLALYEPLLKTDDSGNDVTVRIGEVEGIMSEEIYDILFQAYQNCSEIRDLYNSVDKDAQTALEEVIQLAGRYGGDAVKIVSDDRDFVKDDINRHLEEAEREHEYNAIEVSVVFFGTDLPLAVAAIFWLVMAILSFKLLKTSNKYTQQVYGTKKVDKNIVTRRKDYSQYKEALKQYNIDQQEYNSYRKQYRAYRVELAYYSEGVARKHKV